MEHAPAEARTHGEAEHDHQRQIEQKDSDHALHEARPVELRKRHAPEHEGKGQPKDNDGRHEHDRILLLEQQGAQALVGAGKQVFHGYLLKS